LLKDKKHTGDKMKKLIVLCLLFISISLSADFIIPREDHVYPFLEMTNSLGFTNIDLSITPVYYQEIINQLTIVSKDRTAGYYQNQAVKHLNRLGLLNKNGFDTALTPIKEIPSEFFSSFTNHPKPKRLFTYGENNSIKMRQSGAIAEETSLFISGMLGYKYDLKHEDNNDYTRRRKYYGVESGGNFHKDFGYYIFFKKGGYTGNADFIEENPDLSIMGDNFYNEEDWYSQVDMVSELDFKNNYLNFSMGYGTMKVGYSITSPIILNPATTPYGYVKYYKKVGDFTYTGFATQLIPDSLKNDTEYESKSYALQTLSYTNSWLTLGVGNAIVYGDNTINLGYMSPLAIYKIMDNKNHGRDNGILFGYGNLRAMQGLSFYGNFYADDLKKDRIMSKHVMNYLAFQGGMKYQAPSIPLETGAEATAVGPGCYSHKSKTLTYTNDTKYLGSEWGSNFLSFAGRIRLNHSWFNWTFIYENVQQGSLANSPFNGGVVQFLRDDITRFEVFKSEFILRLTQELTLNAEYQYKKQLESERHYILTSAEFKF